MSERLALSVGSQRLNYALTSWASLHTMLTFVNTQIQTFLPLWTK